MNLNFLPWRQLRRDYRVNVIKKFIGISILLSIVFICVPHFWFKSREDQLNETISNLKQSLAMLEEERKLLGGSTESAREESHNVASLASVSALFFALSQFIDTKVCFSSVAKHKNTIAFNGESRSIMDLSIFIASWQAAKFFTEIKIEKLTEKENHKVQFRLRAIENV